MDRSKIIGLASLLMLAGTTHFAHAQSVYAPVYSPDRVESLPPLNAIADDVVDLKDQVRDLQAELAAMKAGVAAAANGAVSLNMAEPLPPAKKPTPEEEQATFNKHYDKARSRLPNVAINGVFQADAGFFNQDTVNRQTVGNAPDGADFRRARLSAKGSVTETMNYFFQMDFAFFGRPTFTDVWLEQTDMPFLGTWRIGQWKQPFSLEVVSSFRYTTFMERSLLFQAFDPFRHIGTGFYNHSDNENWTWAASGFRSGQDQYGNSVTGAGGWATAERLTHLAWWDEASNGRGYLHLGAGHFFATPPDHLINFRTIPELFLGQSVSLENVVGNNQPVPGNVSGTPFFLQTGALNVNTYNVLGAEMLYVRGPFSWQTEPMVNIVQRFHGDPTVALPGFYSQVGWFLTGEHRPYDRKSGTIDRVMPFENFFRVRTEDGVTSTGRGAWELAFRVSHLDFSAVNRIITDKNGVPIDGRGGTMTDFTTGVNWYWNPYCKLVFNWVNTQLDVPFHGSSQSNGFAGRAQIDF